MKTLKIFILILTCTSLATQAICTQNTKPLIQIVLGSTRDGRTSNKIGKVLKEIADKNNKLNVEIVDLKQFNLPFLSDSVTPESRKTITDSRVKKWSNKIKKADGFVIVFPEYNSGYPGVLKNALDTLYAEWNNKPVAFVSYSGGKSGGTTACGQLKAVVKTLKMNPVDLEINIPSSWKAFDENGQLVDKTIEKKFTDILEALIKK